MTLATKIIFIAALILSIIIPFGYYLIGEKNKKRYKRTIGVNAFFFFGAFALASIMMLGGPDVQAAEAAASGAGLAEGLGYIAAALVPDPRIPHLPPRSPHPLNTPDVRQSCGPGLTFSAPGPRCIHRSAASTCGRPSSSCPTAQCQPAPLCAFQTGGLTLRRPRPHASTCHISGRQPQSPSEDPHSPYSSSPRRQ